MAELDQGTGAQAGAPVGGDAVDQQAPQQPAGNPELTIADLTNLRAVIDVAAQRGAFRAAEMAAVGACFNKLNSFLEAVYPQQLPPSDGVADGVKQDAPAT
jgi:hypothetical protein